MDFRRLFFNITGVVIGGGLMYALIKKTGYERQSKTVSAMIVEGSALTGGALLGYHLSNFAANRLLQNSPDSLPQEQAPALTTGDQQVETPTAETAMGNVAKKAAATTPVVSPSDIGGGQVIDISTGKTKGQE